MLLARVASLASSPAKLTADGATFLSASDQDFQDIASRDDVNGGPAVTDRYVSDPSPSLTHGAKAGRFRSTAPDRCHRSRPFLVA
jgi:hypothetical protein